MALPSQTARPIARRHHMYRRSRRQPLVRPWMIVAAAVAVVALIAYWLWPGGDENLPPQAAAGPDAAEATGGTDEPATGDTGRDLDLSRTWRPIAAREEATIPPVHVGPTTTGQEPERGMIEMGAPQRPAAERRQPAPPPAEPAAAEVDRSGAAAPAPTAEARRARARLEAGLELLSRNEPVQGRVLLTQALLSGGLGPADERLARDRLTEISRRLVFSPEVVAGDPFAGTYTIESGDLLSRLPRKLGIYIDWRFLKRINRIPDERRIRPGQRIKIVTGPFHAVISKRNYRLDLYLGDGAERIFVRSFPVGLGEYNSTPEGRFRIREQSKLINPRWVNRRTGQRFLPDDPDNPIGEHWIGLVGDEERLASVTGYGIHGTIEPDTIGRQASMGCVRLLPEDVAIIWEVLLERVSTVEIRP